MARVISTRTRVMHRVLHNYHLYQVRPTSSPSPRSPLTSPQSDLHSTRSLAGRPAGCERHADHWPARGVGRLWLRLSWLGREAGDEGQRRSSASSLRRFGGRRFVVCDRLLRAKTGVVGHVAYVSIRPQRAKDICGRHPAATSTQAPKSTEGISSYT